MTCSILEMILVSIDLYTSKREEYQMLYRSLIGSSDILIQERGLVTVRLEPFV